MSTRRKLSAIMRIVCIVRIVRGVCMPWGGCCVVVGCLLVSRAVHAEAEADLHTHNTWFGSSGGVRVIDAGSGDPGTLRLQLGVDYFRDRDFLAANDTHQALGGTLSLSATPIEHLELFGSFAVRSNSNDRGNPILLQVIGDLAFGAKGYAQVAPWLSVGGDLRFLLLNTVGDLGVTLGATSIGLRGAATADLRRLPAHALPLITRAHIGYLLDNSSELVENVERERYAGLPSTTRSSYVDEDRQLISRVERFGLGINRVDLFTVAVGVEAPLPVARDFYIQPLVEWEQVIPVNRQGYDCLSVPTDARAGSSDACLATAGYSALPSTLTLGARVLPPARGLSVLLAGELGLTGARRFVRELAPTRPWALLIALAYSVDTRRPKPERIVTVVNVPAPVDHAAVTPAQTQTHARMRGTVAEQGSGAAVIGAVVRYPGRELSPQLTGAEGGFISYGLEPGEVVLEITHPDYDPARCVVEIPLPPGAAGDAAAVSGRPVEVFVPVRCELNPRPKAGGISGQVVDERGTPLRSVQVELLGPAPRTLVSLAHGELGAAGLPVGEYTARVAAPGYLLRAQRFEVRAGEETPLRIVLIAKPKVSQVLLTSREVKIGTQVVFKPSSADIDVRSIGLLSEVADLLARNPQLARVDVQGHTDNRGDSAENLALSQRRAEAVVRWLVDAGIEPARLEAHGFGDQRPLVPNLTSDNRARNRRVQFIIQSSP
ncbi:MAG: OmpA family protein [Polyangiales bacterium]